MQYDVALNGWELGGGSVRIHRRELLERSFALQGYSLEQMHERFGGILEPSTTALLRTVGSR